MSYNKHLNNTYSVNIMLLYYYDEFFYSYTDENSEKSDSVRHIISSP